MSNPSRQTNQLTDRARVQRFFMNYLANQIQGFIQYPQPLQLTLFAPGARRRATRTGIVNILPPFAPFQSIPIDLEFIDVPDNRQAILRRPRNAGGEMTVRRFLEVVDDRNTMAELYYVRQGNQAGMLGSLRRYVRLLEEENLYGVIYAMGRLEDGQRPHKIEVHWPWFE